MKSYTFEELTERYSLSKAGFSKFFHNNEDKLVTDGQKHYRQEGKKIFFDEDAVEIMDQLRGLNKDIISFKEETANEVRIKELLEENSTLKTQMLLLQEESKVDKERIIKLTEETIQIKLLTERNKDISEQLDIAKQAAAEQLVKYNEITTELTAAKTELSCMSTEAASAKEELSVAKSREVELTNQYQALQKQNQAEIDKLQQQNIVLSSDKNRNSMIWIAALIISVLFACGLGYMLGYITTK